MPSSSVSAAKSTDVYGLKMCTLHTTLGNIHIQYTRRGNPPFRSPDVSALPRAFYTMVINAVKGHIYVYLYDGN